MGSRGRKSDADLKATPIAPRVGKPPPPDELTFEQQTEWRAVVNRMPADWFAREHFAILAAYCRHVSRHRQLSGVLDQCPADKLEETEGLNHYNRLSQAAERESRALLACARALRLTNQSRYDPEAAGRKSRQPQGPKPWEM